MGVPRPWNVEYDKMYNQRSPEFRYEFSDLTIAVEDKDTIPKCMCDVEEISHTNEWGFTVRAKMYRQVEIKKVIFNRPATIVFWSDGDKTVVKCCNKDYWDPRHGLTMAICKKGLEKNYSLFLCIDYLPSEKQLAKWICKKILGDKYVKTFRKYEDDIRESAMECAEEMLSQLPPSVSEKYYRRMEKKGDKK